MANYVRTTTEKIVIDAVSAPKISTNTDEIINKLIDIIAKWQFYVGIKNPSSQELILMGKFIQSKYSNLSCEEVSLAIDLSLEGKLDISDIKPYGVFSPLYVSTILNAYIDYKLDIVRDVVERYEHSNPPLIEAPKMTLSEQAVFMKELILNEYQIFKQQGGINDHLSMIYDFLKKTKRLVITEELKDRAILEGQKMYNEYISKQRSVGNMVDKFWNYQDKKAKVNKMSREFCVMEYFRNVDIGKLVQSIKDDEFA